MRKLLLIILFLHCCRTGMGQITARFTADKAGGCGPLTVHFSNQTTGISGPASYQWDLGDGNTASGADPEAIYTQPGSYTITLTVKQGNQRSETSQVVTVYTAPTANFTVSATKVCSPTPIQFTSASTAGSGTISSYLWDFGDGTTLSGGEAAVGHSYRAAGVEGVSLTVTDIYGCTATKADPALLTILPRMQVAFTEDRTTLCAIGDPVQFTNNSTGPGVLSYSWSFGDGGTSTQPSPSYSYGAKGAYSVVLTATSSAGCVVSDTQTNVLNVANFQAGFSVVTPVCAGASTIFSDLSSPAADREQWMVDGDLVAAPPKPPMSFVFGSAGTHTVTLTDLFGGCRQSVTQTVTVNAPPVIPPFDVVPQSVCGAPVTVKFLDHTVGAVAWNWVFNYNYYGGQQVSVPGGPANSTQYDYNGDFGVQLSVTNAAGCSASVIQSVPIDPAGGVYIEDILGAPEGSCGPPITRQFATPQIGSLTSWTWDFGDGTTSTAPSPTHTFSAPGGYNTILYWTNKNGCTGSTNYVPTIISSTPVLSFTADNTTVCAGEQVNFTVPGQFASAQVTWTFGDGQQYIYSDGNVVHNYSQAGVYPVTLQVTTTAGCYAELTKTDYITVLPSPLVGLSATNTCSGNRGDVTFNVQVGAGATSLVWNFGDGQTQTTDATVSKMVHSYTSNGDFPVTVVASNGTCSITGTLDVKVMLTPKQLSFTLSSATVCPDGYVDATVLAGTGNPANTYYEIAGAQFQYGDSTNYQGYVSGSVFYPYAGDYSWRLTSFNPGEGGLRVIVTDGVGCFDTSAYVPLVIGGVKAGYEIVQDDRCYQLPVILADTSTSAPGNPIVSWTWDFGDGATSTRSGTVSHLYASPGNYLVRLTVQDASGCSTSSASTVAQVTANGPQAAFSVAGGTVIAQGSTVQFFNTSNVYGTTNVVWAWKFGDGSTSAAFDPTYVYSNPGTYTVTLTATDAAGGCASVATAVLTIQPFNTAFGKNASYVTSGSCPPVLVQLHSMASNYTSITWDFGDGSGVSNVTDPSHVYAQPGKYIVTFTVVGTNGTTVVTVDSVVVLAPETSLQAATAAVCVGQADTLHSKSNEGVKVYSWDFGDGTVSMGSDSGAAHVYTTAGVYTAKLVVTDSLGCSVAAAATDVIGVHAPPEVALTPPRALVCLGSSVELSAVLSGATSYQWSPATGLDQANISTPNAAPGVSTVYTVTVTDAIGCTNSGSIPVTVVRPDTLKLKPDSAAICPGASVQLQASGTYSYQWIGSVEGLNSTNTASPVAQPAASTGYKVVGSDSAGCFSDTLAVPVTVLAQPTVNAGPDVTVQAETPVTLPAVGSSDIVSWQWAPATDLSCADCAQPVCTPRSEHDYIVTVTGADGCVASDTLLVKLSCDETKVRIPDAFTPNGDGHNDRWTILGGISSVDHLVIFDRWGVKVFEENHFFPADPGSGWDGTVGGRPAPAGVYAYFVQMRCPTGGVFTRKGTVVLVR
jgi:gliding motility-associated-like protein